VLAQQQLLLLVLQRQHHLRAPYHHVFVLHV
jgi:hypothetical protein